jgi:hypothetical protein
VGELSWLGAKEVEPPEGWQAAFTKLKADYSMLLAGSRAEAANKEKVSLIKDVHGNNKKLTETRWRNVMKKESTTIWLISPTKMRI